MRREKFLLTYLICLLTWLPQSQEKCIKLPQEADNNDNLNLFELVAKVRGELNAEKRHIVRSISRNKFLGSNLFDGIRKKCFTIEETSLLSARAEFESMVPKNMPPTLLTERQAKAILRYFCYGHFLINKLKQNDGSNIIRKAYYDTLGGFLHYYLIPAVKASYYAGNVKVETVLKVMAHYQKCRRLLNTNGNGWRDPDVRITKHIENGHIRPLEHRSMPLQLDGEPKYCGQLDLHGGQDDGEVIDDMMLVSLPKIEIEDADGFMGNIYLPYERKRTFNLRSPNSATVLIDFYRTVMGCYEEKCMNPKIFKSKLRDWIAETVQPHLNDEIFYPGLGSVLSLYHTLQRSKKKKSKKPKCGFSSERAKRCREDIQEAERKHRCKTMKFINLENKASQCQTNEDECHKDWLKDPAVSGLPKPKLKQKSAEHKAAEKKGKWFGIFGFGGGKTGKTDDDKESGKTKSKDKDRYGAKREDKDYAESILSELNISRLYKKGAWGIIFPRLEGLSFFEELWEVFKFILFLIVALFVLWLLFLTVTTGPSKLLEFIKRALRQLGRLFMKVWDAIFRCTKELSCWRMRGGKEGRSLNEPVPIEKVLVIPKEHESRKAKLKRHRKTKEKESSETEAAELTKKSKVVCKPKRDKKPKKGGLLALPPPEPTVEKSTKKSKEKDKTRKVKKSKEKEPPASETTNEETSEHDRSKKGKLEKNKKDKEKPVEQGRKETGEKQIDGKTTEVSDVEETKTNRSLKLCFKSRKSSDEKQHSKKMDKKSKEAKPTKSGCGKVGRKAKQKAKCDNESQDSSERLLGGTEACPSSDQHTDCSTDSSDQESNDGKSSWKTFYDF